ncbi:putative insulysin [Lupinus albus]|uniref:Putative insulysin n=1 Tax=Lupinus albus TaxID=3870 RepID=A0A6A4NYR2_LUPAL|nr:putative insulysin [Lupinus albus]
MGLKGKIPTITFSSDDVVLKSPNDRRLYRLLQLQNGLRALLVHDPEIYPQGPPKYDAQNDEDEEDEDEDEDDDEDEEEYEEEEEEDEEDEDGDDENEVEGSKDTPQTKKAAAAMCVGIGSFSDPFEAQGLAHFLEHMLFMGSKEFPDENEYDSYLSKHGGSSNAYTETEHTCYHFEVKPEFLKGALQRFSQFFISPLVKTEAMDREVLAVDSEFNQALQSDACRLQQLQCHTSTPGHPLNRFFWGNKKSLVDAMEKGINLREHILKLYNDHYHGGLMKLVVIGGDSLDLLESWVVELFGAVKKGPQVKPEFTAEGPIWKSGKVYWLEAVKDVHILDLSWQLPCLHQEYLKKPEDYLAHLLGHEGKGSLLSYLKARGWATSLSAGVGDEGIYRSTIASVFVMSIHLTDSGVEKIFDIIGFVYQFLKLLRQTSPQEWIFKELQNIGNMEFRFAEEQPQDDYAAELSENLQFYPSEHVIYGDYVFKTWDEQLIEQILGFLIPEKMRVDVVSKLFLKSEDFQCEPWFGSRYVEEDIAQNLLELWRNPPEIDSSLHLPSKNEFIPSDFSIRADDSCTNDFTNATSPRCIIDEALIKFWYMLDSTFKVPRANTYFRINLKGGYDNAKSCVLSELFIHLLKDQLNEIIYQASIAKLETSVSYVGDKLELKVYGFNEKLPILLSKVLSVATSFIPTDDRFKVIKEDMKRTLKNTNMKPLSHSSYLRLQILCQSFYDVDEKLRYLNDLILDDLKAFIPELRSQLYIEGLCHGNLSEEEAISISNIFKVNFQVDPLPIELRHAERVICLPSGANLVRDVSVKNKLEKNSVIELYFQIEQDVGVESTKLKALIDLFDEIVEEPLFNQLRTKEQLGYVVQCSPRITYRVFGFCFCIQSSEYNPVYLQARVDNFIDGLEELLDGLDEDSFENYKSGLMAKLLEKDPSLSYESNRLWNQIVDKRYIFDMSKKEAEELRNINKHDVVEWYKMYFKVSSPKCRRLLVRVWGCNTDMKDAEALPKSVQVITDPASFKLSSKFYPSVC